MDQIWWNHIIKAHAFLENVVKEAAGGHSLLLTLPDSVPWKSTFLDLIREQLLMENPKNKLEVIECPEEEPGEFILQKYCKRETRAKYRYGVSYAQFLGKCQETVLNDRYVWVSDIPDEKVTKWLDFVSEYQKNVQDKTPGIFILEVHNDVMNRKSKKGIRSLGFEQNIGAYDKYAFCALASSETNCKEFLRPYLAEAVASVCGDDVELCAVCVAKGMEFLNAPYETIQKVTEGLVRSDGERYCFSKSQEEVDTLLWEAQLKYVFPLVENYRRYFVKKYYAFIKAALPINNGYGDQVMVPEEAELGNLMYLVERGGIPVSAEESMELKRYRKARNELAHMNLLSNEELCVILKAGKHKTASD